MKTYKKYLKQERLVFEMGLYGKSIWWDGRKRKKRRNSSENYRVIMQKLLSGRVLKNALPYGDVVSIPTVTWLSSRTSSVSRLVCLVSLDSQMAIKVNDERAVRYNPTEPTP